MSTDAIHHDPEARADEEQLVVTRTIAMSAPLGLVWDTLTAPEWIARWFGDSAEFPDGMHEGAEGWFGWDAHGRFPVRVERFEVESAFAFTWGQPGEPIRDDNSTTATFTLERQGDATLVTVVETGFERLGDRAGARLALEDNRQGWTEELDEFVALVARRWSPAVADAAAGTIVRSIELDAPRERVWAALTDPAAIERWWGRSAQFPEGLRPGAIGSLEDADGTMSIRTLVLRESETWAFRWGEPAQPGEPGPGQDSTDVRFDLEDSSHGTRLTVVESGWRRLPEDQWQEATRDGCAGGWNLVLDGLREHLHQP